MKPSLTFPLWPLAVATLAILAGCTEPQDATSPVTQTTPPTTATSTPAATPNIAATVEAAVRSMLTTPVPVPSLAGPRASDVVTPLLSQVVSGVLPAVVAIRTPAGTGSGFFISENGLILTNAHVVGSFFKATVVGRGGALEHGVTADVIAVDDEVDLAVISVSSDVKRHFLEFADSDALALADDVVVIGYPLSEILGEAITVTKGILSSKREVDGLEWLQADAAVNPGNSGGPLVNVEGEVVGIITLRVEGAPAGRRLEGTGFALSASVIKKRLPGLTE